MIVDSRVPTGPDILAKSLLLKMDKSGPGKVLTFHNFAKVLVKSLLLFATQSKIKIAIEFSRSTCQDVCGTGITIIICGRVSFFFASLLFKRTSKEPVTCQYFDRPVIHAVRAVSDLLRLSGYFHQ